MTVNELIQQLQEIPDGLKNCEVVMRQYNGCPHRSNQTNG